MSKHDQERLVRIETKLCKLMVALGIDPNPDDDLGASPDWLQTLRGHDAITPRGLAELNRVTNAARRHDA